MPTRGILGMLTNLTNRLYMSLLFFTFNFGQALIDQDQDIWPMMGNQAMSSVVSVFRTMQRDVLVASPTTKRFPHDGGEQQKDNNEY